MKKAMILSTLLLTAMTQTTQVFADASTEENIGAASGALVGAAAAGPVGFIIGAAIGVVLGDEVNKAGKLEDVQFKVAMAEKNENKLQQQIAALTEQVNLQAAKSSFLEGSDMLQMDLLFHTNSSTLDSQDDRRVQRLAEFLKRYPSLVVRLDGFADPRGNQQDNQKLSQARVDSVKQGLIDSGIDYERIFVTAHGETASKTNINDIDAFALERRVTIRFSPESSQAEHSIAANN